MGHILENEKKEQSKVKKQVPLRLSKELYDEIAQWAEDERTDRVSSDRVCEVAEAVWKEG